jgi:EmrB/QacA subfamily drug resistance transporter
MIDDPKKQKLILYSIAFATFIGNLDYYIVNVALVTIANDFQATTGDVSWVLLSYQLTITSFLLLFGKLGDKFGMKRVFLFGFTMFSIGSLACGLASTLFVLVLSRALQGLGASVLYSMPPAMVTKYLPENKRGSAFGILSTTAAIGMILGAPLGGIITGYCSWRWAFLINIPIGMLAIYIANKMLPGDNLRGSGKPSEGFDTFGALFSFIATINFFYALSMIGGKGWTSPVIITCLAISMMSIFFFIKWERRHLSPLVDLALFGNRTFVAENVSCALAYAFLAGNNFIMPFYLQAFQGLSPQKTGMVFILYSLVYMVTGPVVGKLSNIVKPRTLCSVAMFFASMAIFGFTFFFTVSSLIPVCIFFACNGFAMATFGTANNTSVMDSAPKGKEGMVAGILRMMMRLGMAVGVCTFEMVFSRAILDHGAVAGNNLALLPPDKLSSGFFYSLITAGILCLIAAILPLLSGKKQNNGNIPYLVR